jgi:phosphatidylglycerophosphate synthase
MATTEFKDARRDLRALTTKLEKRALLWLAARMPAWVNSDHLTALGLLAMLAAGGAYWLGGHDVRWLYAVNGLLVVNWFGDSLDGTLARFRDRCRPRYGFYVDHMVDMFGAFFLLGGLALSGYMSAPVAAAFLLAYYLLSIHVYLATYTLGVFQISFAGLGGTELRLMLIAGNALLIQAPHFRLAGHQVFDVAGALAAAAMTVTLMVATVRSTRALYRLEPLPAGPSAAVALQEGQDRADGRGGSGQVLAGHGGRDAAQPLQERALIRGA